MLAGHQNKLQIRIQDTRKPFSFKFHQNRMKIKISQVTPPPLGGGELRPPPFEILCFLCAGHVVLLSPIIGPTLTALCQKTKKWLISYGVSIIF